MKKGIIFYNEDDIIMGESMEPKKIEVVVNGISKEMLEEEFKELNNNPKFKIVEKEGKKILLEKMNG